MNRFERALSSGRILIADGGMGTLLQERARAEGLAPSVVAESTLLESPQTIRSIHSDYVEAGAEVILTCTFGASRVRLAKLGLDSHLEWIHRTAAAIAREAAGPDLVVVGDLGPLGEFFAPMGRLTYEEAWQSYAERAEALVQSGCVDAILIETQYDLREVEAAVDAVHSLCALPVIASMSFDSHGHTMMGVSPEQMASALTARGVDVIGANCGRSVEETLEAIQRVQAVAPTARLWAKPNAGLPRTTDGRTVYDLTPEGFALAARRFVAHGVRVFGGCCGTTPAHITAAAAAIRN